MSRKVFFPNTFSFVASLKQFGLHADISRKDVIFNCAPIGWISWSVFVGSLYFGSTLVLYDGYLFETSPTRFWDLVDKFGVTYAFMWSTMVEFLKKKQSVPTQNHSLKTLRSLLPSGSPTEPHIYDFLANKIKPGLFCCPSYGCTEFFGTINSITSDLPVYRGEIQAPALGMDLKVLDEQGKPVIGKRGTVVISSPYPTMPTTVLNSENESVMKETYLTQYPGHWYVGDDVIVNPVTKGWIIYGRSAETMTSGEVRFSCSEIYSALAEFNALMDSLVTSQYNSKLDERVVLFVKMLPGHPLTMEIKDRIKNTITENLSVSHVPELIIEVPDIPYNLTGKKLNLLVKELINKQPVLNTAVVANPESLQFFESLDLGDF